MVSPQPTRRLYTPSAGLVEARLRASADRTVMLAFWLIGFEEGAPTESGEICVVELFGDAIGPRGSQLSIGVKAHHDPRLSENMSRIAIDLDATQWHDYAAAWDADGVTFYVDGEQVRTVRASITYELQLMLDLFEFPAGPEREPAHYPKTGHVAWVRGYRPAGLLATRPGTLIRCTGH